MVDYIRFVSIAADVGSLVQEPDRLSAWTRAVAKEITEQRPTLAILHLQGLKTKGQGNETLQQLIKELDNQSDIEQFSSSREFHDLENSGMCSFYYFKGEVEPTLFDFQRKQHSPLDGHRSEDAARSNHVQLGKLSEAGYMMSKWSLFGRPFTFVNLSMTEEQSALDGVRHYPTDTVQKRHKELESIMEAVSKVSADDAIILGGNFNCQIDKEKYLKDYLFHNNGANHEDEDGKGMLTKVEGIDLDGRKLYTITEDSFDFLDLHEWVFGTCKGRLIKKYDKELNDLEKYSLHEPNIYFAPNGPYAFDTEKDTDYFTRKSAPAWKQRILCNEKMWNMMHKDSFTSSSVYYGLVGVKENIGECKPVSLISTVCLK